MNNWIKLGVVAMAAALTAACGSDDNDAVPRRLDLRVVHASPDAPKVNVLVNGAPVLEGVDYQEGSAFLPLNEGTYDLAVQAIVPGGNATVIDLPNTALDGNTDYTVLAVGKVAAGTLAPLVIANPKSAVTSGQVRVQVVHASPDAPAVDVYVTAPGASLAGATPLGTVSFTEDLGPVEVPGGNYQIRVTLPGDPATVVFDSGTVALPAGGDLLVAAVTNTGPGPALISLVVNTGAEQFGILDAGTPADIRVGHLSPDAPAVDVVVNDDLANPAVAGLTFPTVTGYLSLPPAAYNFKVVDSATQSLTVIDLDATLEIGKAYSVLASGFLASIGPLVLEDNNRSVATEARVRIVHASPTAGNVDIYVTAPGTDITTVTPAFANVPFEANTGYVSLAPGTYQVSVTPAGNPGVVAIGATLPVAAGDVYTALARDAAGGGAPLGLVVIDELN
jgi:trimeric autotransporter adhesin